MCFNAMICVIYILLYMYMNFAGESVSIDVQEGCSLFDLLPLSLKRNLASIQVTCFNPPNLKSDSNVKKQQILIGSFKKFPFLLSQVSHFEEENPEVRDGIREAKGMLPTSSFSSSVSREHLEKLLEAIHSLQVFPSQYIIPQLSLNRYWVWIRQVNSLIPYVSYRLSLNIFFIQPVNIQITLSRTRLLLSFV